MNILNRRPSDVINEFVIEYERLFGVTLPDIKTILPNTSKFYSGLDADCPSKRLEAQWYDNLSRGIPDYSVYNDPQYILDVVFCWKEYSRNYIRALNSPKKTIDNGILLSVAELLRRDSSSVLDLGNGVGYSTAMLKELFPNCNVYGYNIPSDQYRFTESISHKYGFSMVSDLNTVGKCDIVFASEYFEHFECPIEHLEMIIDTVSPKHLIIANSFNTKSIGHFTNYRDNDIEIPQTNISRMFNKAITKFGYYRLNTKIYNQKPAIYSRA